MGYSSRTLFTNAAVGWLKHMNLSPQCDGNGVYWASGNSLRISDSVIQGFSEYGVIGGPVNGGFLGTEFDNVYMEAGSCSNPLGAIGRMGVYEGSGTYKVRGGADLTNPFVGQLPVFANTGGTTYLYYAVIKDTTASTVSDPFLFGYANTNGSGNIVTTWPCITNGSDTITYDILRTTQAVNAPVPYGTAAYSIATSVAQGAGSVCTATDSNSTPSSYVVAQKTLNPNFTVKGALAPNGQALTFWPGGLIMTQGGANAGAIAFLDDYAPTLTNGTDIVSTAFSGTGGNIADYPTVFAHKCEVNPISGSPLLVSCLANGGGEATSGGTLNATILGFGIGASGGSSIENNLKGRLIFEKGVGTNYAGPSHWITLADSNPFKTYSYGNNRPPNDANDVFIGFDPTTSAALNAVPLAFGSPVSISNYIANAGNGSSWLERLTATAKTFTVPLTAPAVTDSALTPGNCLQASTGGLLTTIGGPCGATTNFYIDASAYITTGNTGAQNDTGCTNLMTAVPAAGGNVYVPAGTYTFANGCTITKPIHMFGAGIAGWDSGTQTTIFQTATAGAVILTIGAAGSLTFDGPQIDNISFQDSSGSGAALGGISILNTNRVKLNNDAFQEFNGTGLTNPGSGPTFACSGTCGAGTSYIAKYSHMTAAGETKVSSGSTARTSPATGGDTMTITGPSSPGGTAVSWIPYIETASGQDIQQNLAGCATPAGSGTALGCAYGTNWAETVTNLNVNVTGQAIYANPTNTSGSFGVRSDNNVGTGGPFDAAYGEINNSSFRHCNTCVLSWGNSLHVHGGEFTPAANGTGIWSHNESHVDNVSIEEAAASTVGFVMRRGGNFLQNSHMEGPSGGAACTHVIIGGLRNFISGNTWVNCTVADVVLNWAALANYVNMAGDGTTAIVTDNSVNPTGSNVVIKETGASNQLQMTAPAVITASQPAIDCMNPAFGCKGDGSTDDSAAIQAAEAYMQAHGGYVMFEAGHTFKIGTLVTITSGDSFQAPSLSLGSGKNAVLACPSATGCFGSVVPNSFVSGVSFQNLQFNGGTNPIDIPFLNQGIFENLEFLNETGCGVAVVGGERYRFNIIGVNNNNSGFAPICMGDTTKSIFGGLTPSSGYGLSYVDELIIHDIGNLGGSPNVGSHWSLWAADNGIDNMPNAFISCEFSGITGTVMLGSGTTALQNSFINGIVRDHCGQSGTPEAISIYVNGVMNYSTISGINLAASGYETKSASIGCMNGSSITNSQFLTSVDNISTFGLYLACSGTNIGSLVGVEGGVFAVNGTGPSAFGDNFSPSNLNAGMQFQDMTESGGYFLTYNAGAGTLVTAPYTFARGIAAGGIGNDFTSGGSGGGGFTLYEKLNTNPNCAAVGTAASPSVASCGAAQAGHFSCATNATGATCTVNTTAVTANSEIFVFESDTTVTGTALG